MPVTLRVVLDQPAPPAGPLAEAARELARALVRSAPSGCEVAAIVPAGGAEVDDVPGLAEVVKAPLARRELVAAWQLGVATGIGGGLIHSPTLAAPLVRHDRVHDHDQTVVTMWDLTPWEAPETLSRTSLLWHKGLLKRIVRHADAVVVPTHAHAATLRELTSLGERVRVIAGAAPDGFAAPGDEVGRRRALGAPEGAVVISAEAGAGLDLAFAAFARAGEGRVLEVLDAPDDAEAGLRERATAAGADPQHVHVRGSLEAGDRAAVLASAAAVLVPSPRTDYPWLALDALALGVPVVAADSEVHREVLLDGGVLVAPDAEGLAAGLVQAWADSARLAVLAADRGRAFSWDGAAERVWHLHAEL
ncbi:glycosyltransferase [Microbacterium sp.]|uniref:glycosyltransferase n=1 Tax=Microbacterium sp. TaxID=51671 RepID=UPI0039E365AD